LLQRKGISWTRLFADLESVFPASVRLVAVRPYLTVDNQVQLDMIVGSAAPEPVIQLIQKLGGSPALVRLRCSVRSRRRKRAAGIAYLP